MARTKEEKRAYGIAYRAKNCEKIRAKLAAYRASRREEARERTRLWRLANPGAYQVWARAHPEIIKARDQRAAEKRRPGVQVRAEERLRKRQERAQVRIAKHQEKIANPPRRLTPEERKIRSRQYTHAYRQRNSDILPGRRAIQRQQNLDAARKKERELKSQWRVTHREESNAIQQRYVKRHPDYQRTYMQNHPEVVAASRHRRRALIKNASTNDLTAQQIRAIKVWYKHTCCYCGVKSKQITIDHVLSLAKGGPNTFSNIVTACHSCNSKKHTGPPLVPVQPLLLL